MSIQEMAVPGKFSSGGFRRACVRTRRRRFWCKATFPHHPAARWNRGLGTRDFNQRVARLNHSAGGGEMRGKDLLQPCLTSIATGEPDDLWRRAETELQIDEVAIFGDDYRPGLCRLVVNRLIVRIPQSQVAHRDCVDLKLTGKPACKTGLELGIQPDGHAASTGWSTNRLA
jgi:hypothetical protein